MDRNGLEEYEYRGLVPQLKQTVDEAMAKFNPTKEWKNTAACQRFTWHHRKDKFQEIRNAIQKWLTMINTILLLKDDATREEMTNLLKEGFTQLSDRMSALEKNEEKRRKEAEEVEQEEITKWLSPFTFIAKQAELFDKNPSPKSADFSGQISASKPGRKAAPGIYGASATAAPAKPSSPQSSRIVMPNNNLAALLLP